MTLCEEAVFQSVASLRLSSVPLERLLENLPGRRVDRKSLERLKKACSPQQQVLQLLRLWREQNKDQDKLYGIIQGAEEGHFYFSSVNSHNGSGIVLTWPCCISRCEPLWEESLPLQQPKKPDPWWPPAGYQQPAGSQSKGRGHPGHGLHLPSPAVHPASSPPLERSQLQPGHSQRSVSQPEDAAQRGGAALPAKRPEKDQPHHWNHLSAQDVWEDVRQHASGWDVF